MHVLCLCHILAFRFDSIYGWIFGIEFFTNVSMLSKYTMKEVIGIKHDRTINILRNLPNIKLSDSKSFEYKIRYK